MKFLFGLVFFLTLSVIVVAQDESFNIPKPTELVIPASPAYQMLDANTALVNAPGAIRDFKVDWSFKTYRLSPNLSIEAQPVYSILYNRPTPEKYQKAGRLLQTLSTLSISAGSLDLNDSIRLFAAAGKITVWRSFDPLRSGVDFKDVIDEYYQQQAMLDMQLSELRNQYKNATDRLQKDSLDNLIFQTHTQVDELKATQKNKIIERQKLMNARYWNSGAIDVAIGRSYSFNKNLSERVDSVKLKNLGISAWVNASFGIGRYILISTLVRGDRVNIELADSGKTVLQDIFIDPFSGDSTLTERDSLFVNFNEAERNILAIGFNIRFGTPRYNFFMEAFMTKSQIFTFQDAQWEDAPENGNKGRRKLSELKEEYIIAFGGEWRISKNVLLSYGIRSTIDKNYNFKNLIPLASITCLMR